MYCYIVSEIYPYFIDEYFLNNIKEIENISELKKKLLLKEFWDETLVKSMNSYPSIKVLDCADSTSDSGECEVCIFYYIYN